METLKNILKWLLPTTWWSAMEGYKSVAGLLCVVACMVLPYFGIVVPDWCMKAAVALFGVGFLDKVARGQKISEELKEKMEEIKKAMEDEAK